MSVKAKNNGAHVDHAAKPNMNADYTHTMLVKPNLDGEAHVVLHALEESGSHDAGDTMMIKDQGSGNFLDIEQFDNNGLHGEQQGGALGSVVDGSWYFLAVVRRSNMLEIWHSPAGLTTAPVKVAEANLITAPQLAARHAAATFKVGAYAYLDEYDLLKFASVTGRKFWTAALSDVELRKESKQKHPVKTTDRWAHWLMKHKDDLTDYSGNGRPWRWAKDLAGTPVPGDDTDIDTDADDSPVPDGEIGQDPEAEPPTSGPRPRGRGRLIALDIL